MKKEIFKLIVAEFQKLGINPTQWLGTRTNVRRINKKNLADSSINEYAFNRELETKGKDRLLKLFSEEAKYMGQLNDMQAATLLQNLKTVNKVMNPPAKPDADIHMFSKLPGKKLTPDEYTSQSAADQEKIQTALLNQAMKISAVDQTLAKRLNLDMSKVSDWEKLQAWKDKHGIPDWAKDAKEGVGSLFKVVEDNPLADLGTQLDAIEKEGKSLVDQAKKLTDMAWEMSPEGQAYREMIRKDINRRSSEGKGYAGGVWGKRNDGFFRAVVRPFLIAQHEKGAIQLSDQVLNSLKQMDDLKAMGDFQSADPVRVFRQHYGNDAFDLIPDQEAFSSGPTGYGATSQERIAVLEKVIKEPIMKKGPEKPGGYLTKGEYQARMDHQDEVRGYIERGEGRFADMDEKEIAQELAELTRIKKGLNKTMNELYPKPKKDPFGIRLMKNFDQDLTDEGLAQEGYNLQEIDILKRARAVMKDPEKDVRHPTEALRWVRGDMADEAGVDIDEFMTTFNWDDKYAQGGGVGSMFRRV